MSYGGRYEGLHVSNSKEALLLLPIKAHSSLVCFLQGPTPPAGQSQHGSMESRRPHQPGLLVVLCLKPLACFAHSLFSLSSLSSFFLPQREPPADPLDHASFNIDKIQQNIRGMKKLGQDLGSARDTEEV